MTDLHAEIEAALAELDTAQVGLKARTWLRALLDENRELREEIRRRHQQTTIGFTSPEPCRCRFCIDT